MDPAMQGQLYNLMCDVTGPAEHVDWFRNGFLVQADNQTTFSADNKTIMFNPVQNHHSGLYHCYAVNVVSSKASRPYLLLVNCE